ncbi:hypothetical protein GCM10009533_52510 [Saccharopolyspora spinosporotrichia]|uniref:Uncharacterized protein n=1 Tax=Saccharopolyspora erythraea TaxID=1836 RepID=A0ABN1DMC9_SACER
MRRGAGRQRQRNTSGTAYELAAQRAGLAAAFRRWPGTAADRCDEPGVSAPGVGGRGVAGWPDRVCGRTGRDPGGVRPDHVRPFSTGRARPARTERAVPGGQVRV